MLHRPLLHWSKTKEQIYLWKKEGKERVDSSLVVPMILKDVPGPRDISWTWALSGVGRHSSPCASATDGFIRRQFQFISCIVLSKSCHLAKRPHFCGIAITTGSLSRVATPVDSRWSFETAVFVLVPNGVWASCQWLARAGCLLSSLLYVQRLHMGRPNTTTWEYRHHGMSCYRAEHCGCFILWVVFIYFEEWAIKLL